jgi:hypothetical protein
MSSLPGRRRLAPRLLIGLLAGLSLTTACASKSPAEPSSAATTLTPNVSIVSMAVASQTLVSGAHVYRVTVKLRESGGAAATIASIDLTFMSGSSAVTSLHVERPISDAANLLAANATLDSRELMAMDEDPSHPHATSVVTKVNYTYGASLTRSADGSAPVPLSSGPTFTLSGIVSEENTAGRAVAGGTVQVVDGPNAGKSSSTDGNGNYTLADLAGGSFSIRASASGYNATERAVTVAQDTRLDLKLLRTPVSPGPTPPPPSPGSCAYTVSPSQSGTDHTGGNLTATMSRTAGNCSWQATSSASWITFPGGASGNGSATLAYAVAPNPTLNTRTGSVTISWAGGSAQIQVQQGHYPDWVCYMSVAKGPQDFNNVPPVNSQLTVTVTLWAVPAGWSPQCQGSALSNNTPWITGGGSSNGGEPAGAHTFTFSVAANSTGTARNGSIVVTGAGRTETLAVRQQ